MADTGWVLAGAGASNASNGEPNAWSDPGNITASDDTYATAPGVTAGGHSEWLVASNFGLSVPDGATIDGIEVRIEARRDDSIIGIIQAVNLYKDDNTPATQDNPGTRLSDTDATYDFGGASDLWGLIWSGSEINAASFQARWEGNGAQATLVCDAMWIKVHYTGGEAPPAGGGPIARSGIFG